MNTLKKKKQHLFFLTLLCIVCIVLTRCPEPDNNDPNDLHFVIIGGQGPLQDDPTPNQDYAIYTSTDGFSWAGQSGINLSRGICQGDGTFIVVGAGNYAYHSENGIDWSQATLNTNYTLWEVAWGESQVETGYVPYFVAVGNDGAALYSTDMGQTWNQGTTNSTADLYSICYGYTTEGLCTFVACGNKPDSASADTAVDIKYSIDGGITWINHSAGGTMEVLHDVTFGNGRFIAVGNNGTILYSNNGAAWYSTVSNTIYDIYTVEYGIVSGSPAWVAGGSAGLILSSSDNGNTWTEIVQPGTSSSVAWMGIVHDSDKFIMCGYTFENNTGYIIYTDTLTSWNTADTFVGNENYFWDIAYKP